MKNNNVRLRKIISLMSEPHYLLFVPPVKRMICALMVNNTGSILSLQFTLFIQHDSPVNAEFDQTHLYLVANMLTITPCPLFDSPEMSPKTER